MTEGLEPCPFCGSENIEGCTVGLGATGIPEYMVYCKECNGQVRYMIPSDPSLNYIYDTIKMWNRRASEKREYDGNEGCKAASDELRAMTEQIIESYEKNVWDEMSDMRLCTFLIGISQEVERGLSALSIFNQTKNFIEVPEIPPKFVKDARFAQAKLYEIWEDLDDIIQALRDKWRDEVFLSGSYPSSEEEEE